MDRFYHRHSHPVLNSHGCILFQLILLYFYASFIQGCTLPQTSDTSLREEIYGPRIEATDDSIPSPVVTTGHDGSVTSLAVSRDGAFLVSTSKDQTIILWDIVKMRAIRRFAGHKASVTDADISPNGQYLVSGSLDATIRIWDINSGMELRRITPEGPRWLGRYKVVRAVAFTPDGEQVVGVTAVGIIRFDWRTGAQRMYYDPKGVPLASVDADSLAISSDGQYLSVNEYLWELETGSPLQNLLDNLDVPFYKKWDYRLIDSAFSPDGKLIAAAHGDGKVRLWSVRTGKVVKEFAGHEGPVLSIDYADDGKYLLSGGSDKKMRVWEIESGEIKQELTHRYPVNAVTYYPDSRVFFGSEFNLVVLWLLDGERNLKGHAIYRGYSRGITATSLNNKKNMIANGMWDGTIRIWNLATGSQVRLFKGHSKRITAIDFSHDGKYLVSGSDDKTIRIWDVETGQEIQKWHGFEKEVKTVCFSADDRYILYGSGDRLILLDWRSAKQVKRFKVFGTHAIGGDVKSARISESRGGRIIASIYDNYEVGIYIWRQTPGGKKFRFAGTVAGPNDTITSIDFSPGGELLLCSSREKFIRIWDTATLERIKKIPMTESVNEARFSPDGRSILVIPEDTVLQLWDLKKERIIRYFYGHESEVKSARFTPDGKYIISVDDSGIQRIWDAANGTQVFVYVTSMENGWLGYTPDGFFDGSSTGWNSVSWRFKSDADGPRDIAPVEIFFREFYYPNILQEVLNGTSPAAPRRIADLDRRQPRMTLSVEGLEYDTTTDRRMINVRIGIEEVARSDSYATGSGVKDLRLFRNGSLVKTWRGDLTHYSTKQEELTAQMPVTAGRNEIIAYAFNRDNIKSQDASYVINGSDKIVREGVAYIIAIGVDKYANSDFNLHYADDDAGTVAATLKESLKQQAIYSDVIAVELFNERATGPNILNALNQLGAEPPAVRSGQPDNVKQLKTAQPEDAVIVFFAGHGAARGDRYYLLPHDLGYTGKRAEMDTEARDAILKRSISDRDFEKTFEGIDAGRIMLIIDACQSGQALESKEKRRGPMNSRGLAQLAYEKGMFILAAAQSYQAALEFTELGHGLLTHTLIEQGLKQFEADHQPRDNRITAREWFDYAVRRVPAETGQANARYVKRSGLNIPADGLTGREIDFGEETVTLQAPRAYYRREVSAKPWVVASRR